MFCQRDPKWANQRLGIVNGTTLGQFGCYVSVLAEIARHFKKDIDPARLDDILTGNGADTLLYADGNLCYPGILSRVYSDIAFVQVWNFRDRPADLGVFVNTYEDEYAIEVDFDHNPSNGTQTHFLRFVSYSNGVLIVGDPWEGDEIVFNDRYGDPAITIQSVVQYRGPLPMPAPIENPAPTPEAPAAPAPVSTPETPVMPEVPTPPAEPAPSVPEVPAADPDTGLRYRVVTFDNVILGSYANSAMAYEAYRAQNANRIMTIDGLDVTAQIEALYGVVDPAPASPVAPAPTLRLPKIDSATFTAIVTWIQVNIPIVLVWLTDPQLIHTIQVYVPWLLPVISGGAAVAAFLIGVFRKDVDNY